MAGTGSKVSLLSAGSSEMDPDRMSLGPLSRMEMLLTASPVCVIDLHYMYSTQQFASYFLGVTCVSMTTLRRVQRER